MTAVVDFHVHIFPDELAPRAMAALEDRSGVRPATDGTLADTLALMDRHGVTRAVVASIATKPSQSAPIVSWSSAIRSERIEPFGSVHPDSPDLAGDLRRIADAGLKGVKLHPLYQDFAADEPRALRMFEAIAETELLVLAHAGWDIGFGPDDRASAERFVAAVERFPEQPFVLAHFGGWKRVRQFLTHLAGRENVWIDTSFAKGHASDEEIAEVLARHDPRRILFATDTPWESVPETVHFVESLPLERPAKADIFQHNAERLLGEA